MGLLDSYSDWMLVNSDLVNALLVVAWLHVVYFVDGSVCIAVVSQESVGEMWLVDSPESSVRLAELQFDSRWKVQQDSAVFASRVELHVGWVEHADDVGV